MPGFLLIDRILVVLIATALLCVPSVSPAQSTTDAEAGIETTQSESLDLKIPPLVPETAFSGACSRVVLAAQVMLDWPLSLCGGSPGLLATWFFPDMLPAVIDRFASAATASAPS